MVKSLSRCDLLKLLPSNSSCRATQSWRTASVKTQNPHVGLLFERPMNQLVSVRFVTRQNDIWAVLGTVHATRASVVARLTKELRILRSSMVRNKDLTLVDYQ